MISSANRFGGVRCQHVRSLLPKKLLCKFRLKENEQPGAPTLRISDKGQRDVAVAKTEERPPVDSP